MLDVCWAAKRRGKYLPLFTDTEMNNCFVYTKPVDSQHQIVPFCLRNLGKLVCKIQKNAWRQLADAIQSFKKPIRACEKHCPLI